MIKIYLDFKSPAAYLALQPTLELLARHSVTVQWIPFKGPAFNVPAPQAEEDKGTRHRRIRAEARRDTHLLYAHHQALPMHFQQAPKGSDLALAVIMAIQGDPLPFIRAAFTAYWEHGQDLEAPDIVRPLLEQAQLAPDLLARINPDALLTTARKLAEADGVVDTPAYVIDGQLFIGREHFPWLEEMLTQHH
ncbi:MAG: DsbA family protein [Pseudomonadota bacterium]